MYPHTTFFTTLLGALTAALLGLAVGLFALGALPTVEHSTAERRWQQRQPQRYAIEVVWTSGWHQGMARVEVDNGQFVRGTNLRTGESLTPQRLDQLSAFASVDSLFSAIEARNQETARLQRWLAARHPLLQDWLNPCREQAPHVRYNAEWGYPEHTDWVGGRCPGGPVVDVALGRIQLLP